MTSYVIERANNYIPITYNREYRRQSLSGIKKAISKFLQILKNTFFIILPYSNIFFIIFQIFSAIFSLQNKLFGEI